jgi:hypothetical protein
MREFGSAGAILVTNAPEPGFGESDQERTGQDVTNLADDPHGRIRPPFRLNRPGLGPPWLVRGEPSVRQAHRRSFENPY